MQSITTWEYSPITAAKRLFQTAHQISVYFYQINRFLVLPERLPSTIGHHHVVFFPDLEYSQIHSFWDIARKIDTSKPIAVPEVALTQLAQIISNEKPEWKTLAEQWQSIEPKVLTFIYDLIPHARKSLQHIKIYPTLYGTVCSFSLISPQEPTLHIDLRTDATVVNIVEAILSSLAWQSAHTELKGTWSESEMIADWLITQTALRDILSEYIQDYQPTIATVRTEQQTKLKQISDEYIRKLGFYPKHSLLTLKDATLYHNDKPVFDLTEKEQQVLSILVQKGKISTDELGEIIFANEYDYSLYAIAKFIERLRRELEHNGLTGSYIQTIRGYGYTVLG